jgi:multidrug efflux pump subunit AcrA (membrane-fusion protein)
MRMNKLSFLIIIAALILTACGGKLTPTPEMTPTLPALDPSIPVITEGRLLPRSRVDLSFKNSGRVGEVLVSEGQAVKAGQPLIRLEEDAETLSELAASQYRLLQAQQAFDNLMENAAINSAQVRVALEKAKDDLEDAQKRARWVRFPRASEDRIELAKQQYDDAEDLVTFYQEVFDDVDWRSFENEEYVLSYKILRLAEDKRDYLKKIWQRLRAMPDRFEVAQKDALLGIAQAQYEIYQQDLNELVDGLDPDQVADAEGRLKAAKAALAASEKAVADRELCAPFNGVVIRIDIKAGEKAVAGSPIITVADLTEWIVETQSVTENEITRLRLDQSARVVLDPLPETNLNGKVIDISRLYESSMGDITYKVTVLLSDTHPQMRWGMTSEVWFIP